MDEHSQTNILIRQCHRGKKCCEDLLRLRFRNSEKSYIFSNGQG